MAAPLITAKQGLTPGSPDDLKSSIAAAREACELLRKMRPATVNPAALQRGLAEREARHPRQGNRARPGAVLPRLSRQPHRPHLRDIAWRPENAVLALGTATSLAQLIFARG